MCKLPDPLRVGRIATQQRGKNQQWPQSILEIVSDASGECVEIVILDGEEFRRLLELPLVRQNPSNHPRREQADTEQPQESDDIVHLPAPTLRRNNFGRCGHRTFPIEHNHRFE